MCISGLNKHIQMVTNNGLICYLPLWWQMLDIFSFCLSYCERSCNFHYLFCKKILSMAFRRTECPDLFSFSSNVAPFVSHSPEVVEKVSPPAPVALPPSIESQDISPTQLAGESIHPCNVYLGCTIVLIPCFGQKITFLYKYCNIDTPKVRISHLNARNFSLIHLYSALLSTFFPMGIFQDHFFKAWRLQTLSFKTCNKHGIKKLNRLLSENLIRSFVLFTLYSCWFFFLTLLLLLIQGVVSRMFHFHRSEQATTSKGLIRKWQRYFVLCFWADTYHKP